MIEDNDSVSSLDSDSDSESDINGYYIQHNISILNIKTALNTFENTIDQKPNIDELNKIQSEFIKYYDDISQLKYNNERVIKLSIIKMQLETIRTKIIACHNLYTNSSHEQISMPNTKNTETNQNNIIIDNDEPIQTSDIITEIHVSHNCCTLNLNRVINKLKDIINKLK